MFFHEKKLVLISIFVIFFQLLLSHAVSKLSSVSLVFFFLLFLCLIPEFPVFFCFFLGPLLRNFAYEGMCSVSELY